MGNTWLDNPIWASLTSEHRGLAQGDDRVRRYPREIGPFGAVAEAGPIEGRQLVELLADEEEVYMLGMVPELPAPLSVLSRSSVLQMVCAKPIEVAEGSSPIRQLTIEDSAAMQELTALAYPYFFRARTHELGRYFGISAGDRLVAMAGERMAFGSYRELSGVCTHPDFVRRGYARQLISQVVNAILADGKRAFLHVDAGNADAQALYRQLGFVDENVVPMVHLRRAGAASRQLL